MTADAPGAAAETTHAHWYYKSVMSCADVTAVRTALAALAAAGFVPAQISLLAREREYWHARREFDAGRKSSATAFEETVVPALPHLQTIAGIALPGGIGLVAGGPIVPALAAIGVDALRGMRLGRGEASNEDTGEIEGNLVDSLNQGRWLIVLHHHSAAEAARALRLFADSTVREAPLHEYFGVPPGSDAGE